MASEMDFSKLQHRCSDECLRLLRRHLPTMVENYKCPDPNLFAGLIIMWFTGILLFKMYSKLRTSWFPWLLRCCTFWSKAKTPEVSVTKKDSEQDGKLIQKITAAADTGKAKTPEVSVTRKDAEQDGKLIQEITAVAETGKLETRKLSSVPNEGELDRKTTEKVIMYANLNPDLTEKTDVLTAEIETKEENEVEGMPGEQKHQDIQTEDEADLRASLKYICKMCVVKCYSEANWNNHLVGKKHQGKICEMMKTAKGNYLCSYCEVDCKNWSNFGSHLKGKKHLSNIQEVSLVFMSANLNPDLTEKIDVLTREIETKEENEVEGMPGEQKHQDIQTENEADLRESLKYICKMCVVKCNGEANWNAHLVGKKHQGKICEMMKTAKGNYLCSYCDVDCQSLINFGSHLKGKKHLSNIQVIMSANLNPDLTEKIDVLTAEIETKEENEVEGMPGEQKHQDIQKEDEADLRASLKYICKMCVVKCYGEANWNNHLVGKKHQGKICEMMKTAKGNYFCSYCDVDCKNWSNFGSHLKGKKHLSNIQEVSLVIMSANLNPDLTEKIDVLTAEIETKEENEIEGMPGEQKHQDIQTENEADLRESLKYICKMCVVKCNGEANWNAHLVGKKHQGKICEMMKTTKGNYLCSYCDVDCQSLINFGSHLKGKKHLSNIQVIMSANLNPDLTEKIDVLTAEIETKEENEIEGMPGEQKHQDIQTENEADLRESLKYICKMCVVKCNGEANWNAHLVGKKHQGKICEMMKTAKGNYLCSYCDVDCQSLINFGSHLKGKKHLSNIQVIMSAKLNPDLTEKIDVLTAEIETNEENKVAGMPGKQKHGNIPTENEADLRESLKYICKMCVVKCNGEANWNAHLVGKKHQGKICEMMKTAKGNYLCSYCDVDCQSLINFGSHLKGKKHLSNIQEVFSGN